MRLNSLEGFGDVFIGIAEGDGPAVGAGGRVFGFCEGGEEPVDFFRVEGLVDFNRCVTGHAGGDAAAAGFGVFGLLVAVGDGEDFFEHAFELDAFKTDGCGFDGESTWAEGFGFEAVAIELVGDLGEGDHLGGEEIDEQRHEKTLALNLFSVALSEDLFEEDALVGDMLIDDPEAFFIGGEDEGIAELAEGFEGGKCGQGVGLLRSGGVFVG